MRKPADPFKQVLSRLAEPTGMRRKIAETVDSAAQTSLAWLKQSGLAFTISDHTEMTRLTLVGLGKSHTDLAQRWLERAELAFTVTNVLQLAEVFLRAELGYLQRDTDDDEEVTDSASFRDAFVRHLAECADCRSALAKDIERVQTELAGEQAARKTHH